MKHTGAKILIESLLAQGVDTVFGYPGGAVLNIFDELYNYRDRLRLVLTSHEQGAAHAADGYARSTGRTGVVIATSGPGATNLVTGIATAYLDSVPLVAITGNVTTDLLGRDSFQEVDITGISTPVTRHSRMVRSAAEISAAVCGAFEAANSGRKGPVLLDIPKNITAQTADFEGAERFTVPPHSKPGANVLQRAAELINLAERPLVFAGGGVTFSDASPQLAAFAKHFDMPVCTSMMGLSSVPDGVPLWLGMAGMHGAPCANIAIRDCDLLVAVGARFSDRVAGDRNSFASGAKIIHIDIDGTELSKNVRADVGICADAGTAFDALAAMLPPQAHREWIHTLTRTKALNALPEGTGARLTPFRILRGLKNFLGDDGIVVTDVGQHQIWTAQYYPFSTPRTFISSCGLGTMGFGLGAAIGAAVGNPGRRVALVTGDGSFHMNLHELAAAVSENLPLVILVMNNRVLGMVHQWQSLFYGGRYSHTEIARKTDYVRLAEAFGASGLRLSENTQIAETLETAFSCGGPCVIDCEIENGERVFPIIPPGGSQSDMIYND